MADAKDILVLLHPSVEVDRRIHQGVIQYIAESGVDWRLRYDSRRKPTVAAYRAARSAGLDGAIGYAGTAELAVGAARMGIPFVNTSATGPLGTARVGVCQEALARMAASHFLSLGFRRFVCAISGHKYPGPQRQRAFVDALRGEGAGFSGTWEVTARTRNAPDPIRRLRGTADGPIAIFGVTDYAASAAVTACREAGVAVPEEAGILGVDDDPLFCTSVQPPLSSIRWPAELVGRHAAHLLDRMLQGRPAPRQPVLLEPERVVVRQSTDTLAIEDREVASALAFIRSDPDGMPTVSDVVDRTAVCRRTLEIRFRRRLGRSILQEIQRVRMDRTRQLLRDTEFTNDRIASVVGYSSGARLGMDFKRMTGSTPGAYRRRFRPAGPPFLERPGTR